MFLGKTLVYGVASFFAGDAVQENAMFVQKVMVPPFQRPPQLAADLGALAAQLVRIGRALGAWFAASLADRAQRRAVRRACAERTELLAMAQRYASTQPEFAKDLVAAAGRDR